MKPAYRRTMTACFLGYIVQAIVNNFAPLLFVMFQQDYGIPLSKITLLIALNFLIQLCIDLLSTFFVDCIGYRASVLLAHGLAATGMILLAFLPDLMPDPFVGLLISVLIYAVGGGLIEVVISPMVEACPTENKEKTMSFLHSFYCWGHVGVVLLSSLYFLLFGIGRWQILTLIWATVPIFNFFLLLRAPVYTLGEGENAGKSNRAFLKTGLFWLFFLMMMCAGAAEQAVSQWASTFAEKGLGVGKTVGDLAGPMSFAFMMGLSRLLYGKCGERLKMRRAMGYSAALCVLSYLLIAFAPHPVLGLIGCALCGFSVGILWPGLYSVAAASSLSGGGTALFALLALAGDLGCTSGPGLAGMVASATGGNLRMGIFAAVIFPFLFLLGLFLARRKN